MNGKPASPALDDRASLPTATIAPARSGALDGARTATAAAVGLETFVAEHYERLLHLAWLICHDGADAGDAVQVGLELAWRRRDTLRDDTRLKPWLDRIVVREAGRIAKRRRSWLGRILSPRPELGWIEPADPRRADPDQTMTLLAALDRLSPEHRAVVALHLYAGYSIAETADLVGAPVETVRSRLRVAKERLRRELEEAPR